MISLLWIAASAYALTLLGYELFRFRAVSMIVERARHERNRDRFGELRTALVRLARENELDVRREVFSVLYRSLSMLMRSPEEYSHVVKLLLWFSDRKLDTRHMPELTPKEGELLIEYAKRLDLLCKDYDRTYRFLNWCMKRKKKRGGNMDEIPLFLQFRWMRKELEKVKSVHKVKASLMEAGTNALAAA